MATNPKIRKALLDKLAVTPQRLSQRAKAIKNKVPMSTEQAHYVLAHEEGIDISKTLTNDEVKEVRELYAHYRAAQQTNGAAAGPVAPRAKPKTKPKAAVVSIKGMGPLKLSVITKVHADEAKLMADQIYPRLYLFENSLRDVIERVLLDKHGTGWWSTVPKKVRDAAAKHKADEGNDAWHGKRGSRELDYVLLTHLWDVINEQWPVFKEYFPNKSWVETLITNDMNVSRRVIAHMNPLNEDDARNVDAAFRKWAKQLKDRIEPNLPLSAADVLPAIVSGRGDANP